MVHLKDALPRDLCDEWVRAFFARTHVFSDNFNLNFDNGADESWRGSSPDSPGWHKDGWSLRHFLESPEQAPFYVLHATSQNPSGRVRFMNNKVVSLKESMKFNRPASDYTTLEASILQALGMDSLDFQITGERKRNEDFSQMM